MGSLIDLLLFSLLLGTCTCNEGATRRGCLCNLGWSGDRCSSTYWNFCIRRKIRSCTVFVHSACIDRRDRFEDYYDRLMTAFGSGADCLFLAPFCHCLACVIVYFPSSNHINCICQLLIANPAISSSSSDISVSHSLLNCRHPNASCVQSSSKCAPPRMT